MLLSSLSTSIANVALPTLSTAFAASFPAVQWVVLAYLLAITALIVSVGRLGDLVGRRLLLVAGLALFSAASLAMAKDGPRPRMNSDCGVSSAAASAIQSQAMAFSKCSGRRASAASSTSSPVLCAISARAATAELTNVLVAATLRSGPARM
ncbi:MFS transporter, partial [Mesorhizobium sp.]|uniref:MFS transporter n=1 Tax=Mesorhizobium sp. TaxID=1871066 RepID=UPI0025C4DA2E